MFLGQKWPLNSILALNKTQEARKAKIWRLLKIAEFSKGRTLKPKNYNFQFKKAPDQTVTELFGHNTDAKWANILYVGQIPEKDIQALEKNTKLYNKIKRMIDKTGVIQFKNEIFAITKVR